MATHILNSRPKYMDYVLIMIGAVCMAIGVNMIYAPMEMVTGGISGLGIVLKDWTSAWFGGEGIPIWITNAVVNVPLFLMAIKLKGRKFVKKTIFASGCFTIALYFIPIIPIVSKDYLMAAIFGGIISGVGLGLVFVTSSSTGGSDLLGAILQRAFRHFTIAQILFVIDSMIVLIGAAQFGINNAFYAAIAVFITSKITDGMLEGLKFAKLVYIISDHNDLIAVKILEKLNRGVTALPVKGMYHNQEKKMLLCVVGKRQVVKLKDIVCTEDKKAFMIFSDAREVMGEGFIEYRQEN